MENISDAARILFEKTHNTVIITLGCEGCYYYDGTTKDSIPAVPCSQRDTIGAGDSHIGSVMACLKRGDTLASAIKKANHVASAVVGNTSALLPDEEFQKLNLI